MLYEKLSSLAIGAKKTGAVVMHRSFNLNPTPHATIVSERTGQAIAVARESEYFHTIFLFPGTETSGKSWAPHNRLTDQHVRAIVDAVLRDNADRAVMVDICPTHEHLPFPDGTDLTKWYGATDISVSQHVIDQTIYFLCVRTGSQ
jgi:hypothetical protein